MTKLEEMARALEILCPEAALKRSQLRPGRRSTGRPTRAGHSTHTGLRRLTSRLGTLRTWRFSGRPLRG